MTKISLMLAGVCLFSLPAIAQTKFTATLTGGAEVPPKSTNGTGTATATLDGDKLTYEVDYQNLSGPATMGHIHGPAETGKNAGVLVPFSNPASPIKGTATLTPEQVTELKAGHMYVNVHTQANPGGEIRGQLTPAP